MDHIWDVAPALDSFAMALSFLVVLAVRQHFKRKRKNQ